MAIKMMNEDDAEASDVAESAEEPAAEEPAE
jgi:hypothetical protein